MGKINIIIGCMFSGKSTETIRIIKRYKNLNTYNLLVINNYKDNRYGDSVISSHDLEKVESLALSNLSLIKNDIRYIKANVIFIEEAQFFSDLFNFVTNAADKDNKEVYVIGLDGDYLRQPFGDIVRLIPHAENIKKLKALCLSCNDGTEACFTKRIVKDNNQELVGSTESYIAVCRKHYIN